MALEYAQKIFQMSDELTSRLRNKSALPKTSIDIGLTHFMSHYFLYETLIPLFEKQKVSVNIREGERSYLLAQLESDKIDFMYTDHKEGIPSSMVAHRVGVNKTFAVAHKSLSKKIKKFPDDLSRIPFFNYTNDSFLKYEIGLFFTKYDLAPSIIGEGDDMDLFSLVTQNALAFTIVPEVAKNRLCKSKEIVVLGELEELQTSLWVIFKKNYDGLGRSFIKQSKMS